MNKVATVTLGMLALGFLTVPPSLQAQGDGPPIPLMMKFSLTATIQNPDGTPDSNGNVKESTTSAKLNSVGILALAAAAHATTYPTGATLLFSNTTVFVADKTGTNFVDDLSDLFTLTFGSGVSSGSYNDTTQASKENGLTLLAVSFDDGNGTSFALNGIVKHSDTVNAPATDGSQKISITFTYNAMGDGNARNPNDGGASDYAIWSGTVSGSGKAKVIFD